MSAEKQEMERAVLARLRLGKSNAFTYQQVIDAFMHFNLALDLPVYYAADMLARLWWDGELVCSIVPRAPTNQGATQVACQAGEDPGWL